MLYLITHAHTQQKKEIDATRWELSPAGREQAAALARLPFWDGVERIVRSSEPKTRLTVAPVLAERRLAMTVDPRYDELRRGSAWVGDYGARVAEVFARPDASIGGWESASDALTRFLEGIHALADAFPRETIALVGHGLTFSLFRAHLLGLARVDFGDWQRLSFCALAQVEWPVLRLAQDFQPIPGAPEIERGG
ncbi:MAG: phosphoglycerate mutase family protein [Caldilineaceae bacterium]|nr:phosphoglycerate mutase family protein [Caldilineaceae bacterium]HRJ44917.1 histidine phosphatase family protein [Caldilineaceae bacterium]